MCLVNNAVYIAKYMTADRCEALYGYIPGDCKDEGGEWTATGTQFQVPYVFKTLFSKEKIEFTDLCETKTVSKGAIYLDKNEDLPEGEHNYILWVAWDSSARSCRERAALCCCGKQA